VKKAVLLPLVALALMLTVIPTTMAAATMTPLTGQMLITAVSPGKVWVTKDGIQQVKGSTSGGTITGTITGSVQITQYSTLNLKTGRGFFHGKIVITNPDGTFEGSFVGVVTGYYNMTGRGVSQGTGAYEGQKAMTMFKGQMEMRDGVPTAVIEVKGILLNPHG